MSIDLTTMSNAELLETYRFYAQRAIGDTLTIVAISHSSKPNTISCVCKNKEGRLFHRYVEII